MSERGANRSRERRLHGRGFRLVAGVDEVGRGCLAGPVAAAAVILDPVAPIAGLRDSKLLSAAARESLAREIVDRAIACSVGIVDAVDIDHSDILRATHEAMRRAIASLRVRPDYLLVDALTIPGVPLPQEGIVKGDRSTACIAAASIVAKVYRDRLMQALHCEYPVYGFHANKGYGTPEHLTALRSFGASPLHRVTFRGVLPPDGPLFAARSEGA